MRPGRPESRSPTGSLRHEPSEPEQRRQESQDNGTDGSRRQNEIRPRRAAPYDRFPQNQESRRPDQEQTRCGAGAVAPVSDASGRVGKQGVDHHGPGESVERRCRDSVRREGLFHGDHGDHQDRYRRDREDKLRSARHLPGRPDPPRPGGQPKGLFEIVKNQGRGQQDVRHFGLSIGLIRSSPGFVFIRHATSDGLPWIPQSAVGSKRVHPAKRRPSRTCR